MATHIDMWLPPVLYVPCADVADPEGELEVDFRTTRDGRRALLVYSALDRLITCCGAYQPWVVLAATELAVIYERAPFDLVLLDVLIPEQQRRVHAGQAAGPHPE